MGFAGEVWPVHPTRDEIAGVKAYRSVADLPGAPDASFVGVNRELTIDIVRHLRERGAGGAVCFASGFSESEAEAEGGTQLQARLVEAAGDMPILGPNCYGFINYLDGALLWPDQHGGVRRASAASRILTQSSNIAINLTMQRRGLPLAFVDDRRQPGADGQAADGDGAGRRSARHRHRPAHRRRRQACASFEALAAQARAAGKPIVAMKVGQSAQARADGQPHRLARRLGRRFARVLQAARHRAGRHDPGVPRDAEAAACPRPAAGQRHRLDELLGRRGGLMAESPQGRDVRWPALTRAAARGLRATLGPMVAVANPLDYHTFIWGKREGMTATFTAMLGGLDLAMLVLDFPRTDRCTAPGWDIAVEAIRRSRANDRHAQRRIVARCRRTCRRKGADADRRGIVPLLGIAEAIAAAEAAFHRRRPRGQSPSPVLLAGRTARRRR